MVSVNSIVCDGEENGRDSPERAGLSGPRPLDAQVLVQHNEAPPWLTSLVAHGGHLRAGREGTGRVPRWHLPQAPYQQGAVAEAVRGVEGGVAGGCHDVIRLQHLVQARGTGVGGHVQGCGPRQVSVFESAKWQVAASSVR